MRYLSSPYNRCFESECHHLLRWANSVHADDAPSLPDSFLQYAEENGVPVLGICHGMQLLVQKLGGKVANGEKHEYGKMVITVVEEESEIFGPDVAGESQTVWMSHGDETLRLPEGFKVVSRSLQGSVATIVNPLKKFYGLQFHPETGIWKMSLRNKSNM